MFRQVVQRIAMLTAIAAVTGGMYTPCKADLALSTPTGLTAGDTFRFVFITDGRTDATSTSIGTYDTFVNSQADGATYNGSTITWQAIGSTEPVDAINHLGVNTSITGVYLVNGDQVATGDGTATGGLWSGTISHAINVDINSATLSNVITWTGTLSDGQAFTPYALGEAPTPSLGHPQSTGSDWVSSFTGGTITVDYAMYGMSQVLTVLMAISVPEPSTGLVAVFGSAAGLVLAWSRKRKERRRQGPVGPTDESQ
ncbi:MAG TPA: hypothetical protein VKA15_13415 [Isosphaeraceae bacterium]|nr:hypothetical protein [Isosphaeraceae bacterium]